MCCEWLRDRDEGQAIPEVRCGGKLKDRRSSQNLRQERPPSRGRQRRRAGRYVESHVNQTVVVADAKPPAHRGFTHLVRRITAAEVEQARSSTVYVFGQTCCRN